MEKYMRVPLEVEAVRYEPGKNLEDGFELYVHVVTNGWISTEDLIQIKREDGSVVCPFVQTRRGLTFIKEGDYIISEGTGDKHVCGEDKFHERYQPMGKDAE